MRKEFAELILLDLWCKQKEKSFFFFFFVNNKYRGKKGFLFMSLIAFVLWFIFCKFLNFTNNLIITHNPYLIWIWSHKRKFRVVWKERFYLKRFYFLSEWLEKKLSWWSIIVNIIKIISGKFSKIFLLFHNFNTNNIFYGHSS